MVDVKSINQSGDHEVTKVELFEFIRKKYFNQGKSIRQIAKEQHVHRWQIRRAIENAVPPARKAVCRKGTVLTLFVKQTIDRWLQEDLQAPRKQRHTAQRIYQGLKIVLMVSALHICQFKNDKCARLTPQTKLSIFGRTRICAIQ